MWNWIFGTKDQKSSFSTLWSMTGEKVKTPQHFYFLSVVSSVLTSGDKLSGQLALLMTVGKHDKRAEDGLLDFQRCVACCGGELFNLTAAVFDFEEKSFTHYPTHRFAAFIKVTYTQYLQLKY